MKSQTIRLPKEENISHTEIADPLKFYYLPFTRSFYIKRLDTLVSFLQEDRYDKLLDIGCGSGIFLKELETKCNSLHAIDVHKKMHLVLNMIQKEEINTNLAEASVIDLPYDSATFDCVIAVSVLEHIRDLGGAFNEISRVAAKGADIVLGFPVKNIATDTIFRLSYTLLPGAKIEDEHVSDHCEIIDTASKLFKDIAIYNIPPFLPLNLSFYCILKATK
ncbi:MAG TPA: class I SAM-dependent methyltransferase [Desulfobacterales bacterium]|nr:class I SAM-dependent methyltransferase [Desulfobacterales bacterium]